MMLCETVNCEGGNNLDIIGWEGERGRGGAVSRKLGFFLAEI